MDKVVRDQIERVCQILTELMIHLDKQEMQQPRFALLPKKPTAPGTARRTDQDRGKYSIVPKGAARELCDDKERDMKKYGGYVVRQRTDGRWYSRVPVGRSKYAYIYGRTQEECYKKLKQMIDRPKLLAAKKRELEAQAARKEAEKKSAIVGVDDWYYQWQRVYKEPYVTAGTIKNMDSVWNNHIRPTNLAKMDIRTVTGQDVQQLLAGIESKCMRVKTYKLLADMFRKAKATKRIGENPLEDDGVIVPRYHANERFAFEPEEQVRFVNAAKGRTWWSIYALMMYQGLRTGEAKALCRSDIKQDCIIVRQSLDDRCQVVPTKNKKERRIPIFAPFRPIADELRGDGSDARIFPDADKHTANDEYREICQELGIQRNMYTLRHTFATNCARAGITPKQVQIWMGHSDVSITLKYYTNISDSFERSNVEKIDTIFDTICDTAIDTKSSDLPES